MRRIHLVHIRAILIKQPNIYVIQDPQETIALHLERTLLSSHSSKEFLQL